MKRRQFLSLSAIAIASPAASWAEDSKIVDYSREAYDEALASGEPFLLDFFAPW